ncbi:MAG: hypothetical protein OEU32_00405 [Acidimicrobiia bacterium]|nr:hypothetical protein [Acidimicrobiia bacterium]
MSGAIAVVAFIVASFVFAGWLARRIMRSVSGSAILQEGEPARAVITGMRETGTTVNENPMVSFDLDVTRPGQAPYPVTTKQMLPRLLLGRVQPGLHLGVSVLPDEPSKVAIDWQSLEGVTSTGDAADGARVPEGLMAGAMVGETVSAKDFIAAAIPAMAEIDQMSETGMTAPHSETGLDTEVFAFVVTVDRRGQDPYEANILQGVPLDLVGRVGPGATVPIGINPADPSDIAINWDEY